MRADDDTPELEEDLVEIQNKIRDINSKLASLPVNYVGKDQMQKMHESFNQNMAQLQENQKQLEEQINV